ncbi:MAG: hypothetical protein KDA45_09955 [Planctomycetales bacterium]|nr:hypothetical protein [Planctomycetales bacterium]
MESRRAAQTLGVDIGGANIKLADAQGESLSRPFPMWTDAPRLAAFLGEMLAAYTRRRERSISRLAVTMTGEMADCFETRAEGVRRILAQVGMVFPAVATSVYTVEGAWLSPQAACADPWRVAASNWHALASWIGQSPVCADWAPQLVVDIGSTTVDVIPLARGCVATAARTDRDRLQLGQLVYTGVGRTSVAAILAEVMLEGRPCPLVAERFATSDDAYLVLGLSQEDAGDHDTADGRARTVPCAQARLARMVAEDAQRLAPAAIASIAQQIVDSQARRVAQAIVANAGIEGDGRPLVVLVSGHGRALAQLLPQHLPFPVHLLWLDERLSSEAARCAPAQAVAWLLSKEGCGIKAG